MIDWFRYILGIRRWCLSLKKSQKHLTLSFERNNRGTNLQQVTPKTVEKNKMFFIGGKRCCKSDDGVGKNILKIDWFIKCFTLY